MRAIRLSFFQMASALRRDIMLFAACFAPVLAGLFFRFVIPFLETVFTDHFHLPVIISPYYRLVDLFFVMLTPTMFCFVSAMVSLEETDEKTAIDLFITPLGKTGYLSARLFHFLSKIIYNMCLFLCPLFGSGKPPVKIDGVICFLHLLYRLYGFHFC